MVAQKSFAGQQKSEQSMGTMLFAHWMQCLLYNSVSGDRGAPTILYAALTIRWRDFTLISANRTP